MIGIKRNDSKVCFCMNVCSLSKKLFNLLQQLIVLLVFFFLFYFWVLKIQTEFGANLSFQNVTQIKCLGSQTSVQTSTKIPKWVFHNKWSLCYWLTFRKEVQMSLLIDICPNLDVCSPSYCGKAICGREKASSWRCCRFRWFRVSFFSASSRTWQTHLGQTDFSGTQMRGALMSHDTFPQQPAWSSLFHRPAALAGGAGWRDLSKITNVRDD